jgi:hypothetical protein
LSQLLLPMELFLSGSIPPKVPPPPQPSELGNVVLAPMPLTLCSRSVFFRPRRNLIKGHK